MPRGLKPVRATGLRGSIENRTVHGGEVAACERVSRRGRENENQLERYIFLGEATGPRHVKIVN